MCVVLETTGVCSARLAFAGEETGNVVQGTDETLIPTWIPHPVLRVSTDENESDGSGKQAVCGKSDNLAKINTKLVNPG